MLIHTVEYDSEMKRTKSWFVLLCGRVPKDRCSVNNAGPSGHMLDTAAHFYEQSSICKSADPECKWTVARVREAGDGK